MVCVLRIEESAECRELGQTKQGEIRMEGWGSDDWRDTMCPIRPSGCGAAHYLFNMILTIDAHLLLITRIQAKSKW